MTGREQLNSLFCYTPQRGQASQCHNGFRYRVDTKQWSRWNRCSPRVPGVVDRFSEGTTEWWAHFVMCRPLPLEGVSPQRPEQTGIRTSFPKISREYNGRQIRHGAVDGMGGLLGDMVRQICGQTQLFHSVRPCPLTIARSLSRSAWYAYKMAIVCRHVPV